MRRALAITVVLAACGRLGFGALGDGGGSGSGDAGGGGDAALPFCMQHATATFCKDFDDGTTSGWDNNAGFNGNYVIDSEALSPPSALRVFSTAIGSGTTASAYVGVNLATYSHVVASCSMIFDLAGSNDAVVIQLSMDDGSERHDLELVVRAPPAIAYVEDANTPMGSAQMFTSYPAPALSLGTWHDIVLDFTAGASARFILSFDGSVVIDMAPMFTTGGQLLYKVGLPYIPGVSTPWTMHVDNALVVAQ